MELLIVLVIIGITVGLVAPHGYQLLDRARIFIAGIEDSGFKKKATFRAFILDRDCKVIHRGKDVVLVCDGEISLKHNSSGKFEDIHVSNKGFKWNGPEGLHAR